MINIMSPTWAKGDDEHIGSVHVWFIRFMIIIDVCAYYCSKRRMEPNVCCFLLVKYRELDL